jgi:hypothetical protein
MEESNSFICESLETAPNGILLPESETFQFVFSLAKLETETLWFRIESFQILWLTYELVILIFFQF